MAVDTGRERIPVAVARDALFDRDVTVLQRRIRSQEEVRVARVNLVEEKHATVRVQFDESRGQVRERPALADGEKAAREGGFGDAAREGE
jgi:maltoporin